jgi:hypothetical protein
MAKSSRASSKKANNQRKAANIFGPAEAARAERLSARLLELAKQAKPESSDMNVDGEIDKRRRTLFCLAANISEADEDVAEKEADEQDEAADNCMSIPFSYLDFIH